MLLGSTTLASTPLGGQLTYIVVVIASSGTQYESLVTEATILPAPLFIPGIDDAHLSYLTQELLNYFDPSDRRVRSRPYSTGMQLLNSLADSIEYLERATFLELRGQNLSACPTNLDNGGVWYSITLPNGYNVPLDAAGKPSFGILQGVRQSSVRVIRPWDPINPVPGAIVSDASRSSIPLASNTILTATGTGGAQLFTLNNTLAWPNSLTVDVAGFQPGILPARMLISGYPAVVNPFSWKRQVVTEEIVLDSSWTFRTRNSWSEILSINFINLDPAVTVTVSGFGFSTDFLDDPAQPYIDPAYRGTRFRRFWSARNNLLGQYIQRNGDANYEMVYRYPGMFPPLDGGAIIPSFYNQIPYDAYAQSSIKSFQPSNLALEPYTYGILAVSGSTIYWANRRTPWPPALQSTGLSQEPAYSLTAADDPNWSGYSRAIALSAEPMGRSDRVIRWRYLMTDPAGTRYCVLPEGGVISYSPYGGWRSGTPLAARVFLSMNGTYLFSLEMVEAFVNMNNGFSVDVVPVPNLPLQAEVAMDVSSIVSSIDGIDHDSNNLMWLSSGGSAVPVTMQYDGYVYDPSSRTLYFTQLYDRVSLP